MKAITLWQPWATWIALGIKTIETRSHNHFAFLAGERIAIHAGKRFDDDAVWEALCVVGDEKLDKPAVEGPFPSGRVVCTAKVLCAGPLTTENNMDALCDCTGRFGLYLTDIQRLDPPVPATGHQGVWEWEASHD